MTGQVQVGGGFKGAREANNLINNFFVPYIVNVWQETLKIEVKFSEFKDELNVDDRIRLGYNDEIDARINEEIVTG